MSDHEKCWICRTVEASPSHALEVKMCGDGVYRNGEGPAIKWNTVEVLVPRCQSCAQREEEARKILEDEISKLEDDERALKSSWGYRLWKTGNSKERISCFSQRRKQLRKVLKCFLHREFPEVKERLAKHWEFGEKPCDREPIMGFGEEFDIHPPSRNLHNVYAR